MTAPAAQAVPAPPEVRLPLPSRARTGGAGWRVALRLARREARRHPLRTALTVLLVAVPVAGLVLLGVVYRTAEVPTAVHGRWEFGQAQAKAYLDQPGVGGGGESLPALAAAVPAGSRLVTEDQTSARVSLPGSRQRVSAQLLQLDYRDPLVRGVVVQVSGTAPEGTGEVAVSTRLADRLRLRPGSLLLVRGEASPRRVTGVVDVPSRHGEALAVSTATTRSAPVQRVVYIGLPAGADPFTATRGVGAVLNPLLFPDSPGRVDPTAVLSGALVVVIALLEAALTAGAAFAVGARRQRRDLALVAVNGATDRHLSRVVLANGVVLGGLGALVGTALGLAAAPAALPLLDRFSSAPTDGTRVDPLLVLAALAFGFVAALLASLVPARLAVRATARAALSGPRGTTRVPGRVTGTGAALLVVGVLLLLLGSQPGDGGARVATALLGVVLVMLGAVAVSPAAVGALGRIARPLPVSLRSAARDAARQRVRSAAAVAAVAATVGGAVAACVVLATDRGYAVGGAVVIGHPLSQSASGEVGGGAPPDPRGATRLVLRSEDGAPDAGDVAYALGGLAAAGRPVEVQQVDVVAPLQGGDVAQGGVAATPELLAALPLPDDLRRAAQTGALVLGAPRLSADGLLHLTRTDGSPLAAVPARSLPRAYDLLLGGALLVPPSVAAQVAGPENGASTAAVVALPRPVGDALGGVERRASEVGLTVYPALLPASRVPLLLLGVVALAVLVCLAVTAVATVLAGQEARRDLAVLQAVGARPGTRRRFQAAQGALVALVGAALGVVLGVVPTALVLCGLPSQGGARVPWQPLAGFLVGLPLLAALGGALLARGRLPGLSSRA